VSCLYRGSFERFIWNCFKGLTVTKYYRNYAKQRQLPLQRNEGT